MISASSQQPSLINQQGVLAHETDPNLSSKIDSLKKQNDNLFMCKPIKFKGLNII